MCLTIDEFQIYLFFRLESKLSSEATSRAPNFNMYNRNFFLPSRGGRYAPMPSVGGAAPNFMAPVVPVANLMYQQPGYYGYAPVQQWNQQPSVNFPISANQYSSPNMNRNNYVVQNYNSPGISSVDSGNNNGGRKRSRSRVRTPDVPPQRASKRSYQQERDSEPKNKKQKPDGNDGETLTMPVKYNMNDKITEGIWKYFEKYRQSDDNYRAKVDLRDALYVIFKDVFPFCGLYMVGSSMSGFGSKTSDMDLCLMLSKEPIEGKKEAVEILIAIQRCLRRCGFVRRSQVIRARVPILKFDDYSSGVECDLNINNSVGIRNTHLLRYYAAMDWRVRPLVLFVKKWARYHDINDASKKTISSYSLCLMVLHYLQFGCNPPVLESVQKLYPDLFDYGDDIRNLKMNVKIQFRSKNSESLGDLFLGFLKYYATEFDFDIDVISVRQGIKLPLHLVQSWTPASEMNMWKCLKIEEPFDRSNTARSCYDEKTFARVIHVFTRSYRQLAKTRKLESILSSPY